MYGSMLVFFHGVLGNSCFIQWSAS